MPTNDFLPFCPDDTGTNLLTQSEYLAASGRTSGNQPGVASSKLNNKSERQSSYIVSQLAQLLANKTGTDVLDDATPAKLLSQMMATLAAYPPKITSLLTGSGNHNITYLFFIATGSATVGATYTNNSVTFTVIETIASGTVLRASGNSAPLVAGTLTKTGGTGDSTITFYANRAPIWLRVTGAGGGGGGGSSLTGAGSTGGNTTFGTTLLVGNGGVGGLAGQSYGGEGGTASLGTGPTGAANKGGWGGGGSNNASGSESSGGNGGVNAFGGNGGGGPGHGSPGNIGIPNTGAGGGGGGGQTLQTGAPGGGAGGYFDAIITAVLSTYAWAVGAGGAGGSGTGSAGAAGGSGVIYVEEHYQ